MSDKLLFIKKHKKLISLIGFFFIIEIVTINLFVSRPQLFAPAQQAKTSIVPVVKKVNDKTLPAAQIPASDPVAEVVKKDPAASPVKPKSKIVIKSNPISGTTVKNGDGTKTTVVAEGNVSSSQIEKIAASGPSGNNPYTVKFIDDTGQNGSLEKTLKDYLNNKLKWGQEISSLYGIEVMDAGDTGWAGQYTGSYTVDSRGNIVTESGWINLNVYYYKSDPNFKDYMKLVLSHEYGHHYTLYYKWMKWKLLAGTRFPDDYYEIRPLSKTSTAYDYSLGSTDFEKWENCDAEIIAEDYSYIYSGYNSQAMSAKFGYPSAALANWMVGRLTSGPGQPDTPVNLPTVSITAPLNKLELSETQTLKAEATGAKIAKVVFYVDNNVLGEDDTFPYEMAINTKTYDNGDHEFKVIAYDEKGQRAEATVVDKFVNREKPIVKISQPDDNPHNWASGNLLIQATGTDDVKVVKMEIYINDILSASENTDQIARIWDYNNGPAGNYTLKIKAYDENNNVGSAVITINKS